MHKGFHDVPETGVNVRRATRFSEIQILRCRFHMASVYPPLTNTYILQVHDSADICQNYKTHRMPICMPAAIIRSNMLYRQYVQYTRWPWSSNARTSTAIMLSIRRSKYQKWITAYLCIHTCSQDVSTPCMNKLCASLLWTFSTEEYSYHLIQYVRL